MNILVTLNRRYIKPLCVMLRSLTDSCSAVHLDIYVLNKSLTDDDFEYIKQNVNGSYVLHNIKVDDAMLETAPVTSRYPHEMYYRIFAAKFLPDDVDRVLYLDPDLVVIKDITPLYNIPLDNNYFAAASHVSKSLRRINEIRLQMETKGPYINSGVMVMNIALLRKEQDYTKVFEYIEKNKNVLFLPDQDIISAVYSDRITTINPYIYNMTERMLFYPKSVINDIDFEWVKQNSAIVHYCGRNKPWKSSYKGVLDSFYKEYAQGIDL